MFQYKLALKNSPDHHTRISFPRAGASLGISPDSCLIIAALNYEGDPEYVIDCAGMLADVGILIAGLESGDGLYCCSPGSPQELLESELCREIRAMGLLVMRRIADYSQMESLQECADLLLVDSLNMQNYALLDALGRANMPVIIERGPSATVEEWLMAAEYVLNGGNEEVILCESGIRTFDHINPRTLDAGGIALVSRASHLPVIARPGKAASRRDLVEPLGKAALAAGAVGLILDLGSESRPGSFESGAVLDFPGFTRLLEILHL